MGEGRGEGLAQQQYPLLFIFLATVKVKIKTVFGLAVGPNPSQGKGTNPWSNFSLVDSYSERNDQRNLSIAGTISYRRPPLSAFPSFKDAAILPANVSRRPALRAQ